MLVQDGTKVLTNSEDAIYLTLYENVCLFVLMQMSFFKKRKEEKGKEEVCGGREAGHLGAERSFSTNIVAHTLHLPPTRTKGERAKRQRQKNLYCWQNSQT